MIIDSKDKNGNITGRVFVFDIEGDTRQIQITSRYDVKKEAIDFASTHKDKLKSKNILYGIGLGYHVIELLQELGPNKELYIFDIRKDIYDFADKNALYEELKNHSNIHMFISDDEYKLINDLKNILTQEAYFFIHQPSLSSIHDKNEKLKFMLEQHKIFEIQEKNIIEQSLLYTNKIKNIDLNDSGVEIFYDKFKDVPGILVSAGPSLGKSIESLKKIQDNAIIFAVGRSLSSLLTNGIRPDFFCIIDAYDITYEQIKGYETENIPFIYLSTASHNTVSSYKGPRFIAFNDKYSNNSIETGGSVATAVFDLLIKFGCNPIIFVGQDLAYIDEKTHYEGAKYENIEISKKRLKNMRKVKGADGTVLMTNLGLISFKKWFESNIKKHDRIFINSYFGAEIKGTKNIPLDEVIEKYINKK